MRTWASARASAQSARPPHCSDSHLRARPQRTERRSFSNQLADRVKADLAPLKVLQNLQFTFGAEPSLEILDQPSEIASHVSLHRMFLMSQGMAVRGNCRATCIQGGGKGFDRGRFPQGIAMTRNEFKKGACQVHRRCQCAGS
jgi:hypothetical protein